MTVDELAVLVGQAQLIGLGSSTVVMTLDVGGQHVGGGAQIIQEFLDRHEWVLSAGYMEDAHTESDGFLSLVGEEGHG